MRERLARPTERPEANHADQVDVVSGAAARMHANGAIPPVATDRSASTTSASTLAYGSGLPEREIDDSAAVEKQPIRTYELGRDGVREVPLREPGARDKKQEPAHDYRTVSEQELSSAIKNENRAKTRQLRNGTLGAAPTVVPEDGSARATAFHMAGMGADATGWEYPLAMARIGEVEGFRVVVRVTDEWADRFEEDVKKARLGNVTVIRVQEADDLDYWSEDQGELHVDGSVSVPSKVVGTRGFTGSDIVDAVLSARVERLHPGAKLDPELTPEARVADVVTRFPELGFSYVGGVGKRHGQRAIAALAVAGDKELRVTASYLEGGNSLVGTMPDGQPYAVVGRDSLALSRAALEKELGRAISDAELMQIVGNDLGVAPDRVIPVEQPHEFHIDMVMSLMPNGVAVVNDALEAARLSETWLRDDHAAKKPAQHTDSARGAARYQERLQEWTRMGEALESQIKRMHHEAKVKAAMEDKTAADLRAGGLEVHRMAGVFGFHENAMNFMNGERAQNANGEQFYVALGGDVRAERYVTDKLANDVPSQLDRIHFLDRELTPRTLSDMGGISCRAKIEGDIVQPKPREIASDGKQLA